MSTTVQYVIREFSQTQSVQRWLYHQSRYSVAGAPVPRTEKIGTLVVFVTGSALSLSERGIPLAYRPIVGPVAGFYELKVPTFAALQAMQGGSLTTFSRIAIVAFIRPSVAARGLTFSEVTNINSSVF